VSYEQDCTTYEASVRSSAFYIFNCNSKQKEINYIFIYNNVNCKNDVTPCRQYVILSIYKIQLSEKNQSISIKSMKKTINVDVFVNECLGVTFSIAIVIIFQCNFLTHMALSNAPAM
jgi:hypothetical protein